MSACPCGLNPDIWQNPWNHETGCSMQASHPTPDVCPAVVTGGRHGPPHRPQVSQDPRNRTGQMRAE